MLVDDVGFLLHKQKYRETSLLLTLLTKKSGKIKALAKGVYRKKQKQFSLFEPGYILALQLKEPKKLDSLYLVCHSELSQAGQNCQYNYVKQMCLYYINELVYYLYPFSVADAYLFEAYHDALIGIDKGNLETSLRLFESKLLETLGYAVTFESDDQGNLINPNSYYQLKPMCLPIKVMDHINSQGQLIFTGETLLLLADLEEILLSGKNISFIKNIKLIYKLYINHLLQGRLLESRRLLLEYKEQLNNP